jgi:hypothetical protein
MHQVETMLEGRGGGCASYVSKAVLLTCMTLPLLSIECMKNARVQVKTMVVQTLM